MRSSPPLNWLLFCCFVVAVALITILTSPSPTIFSSSRLSLAPDIYSSYRSLREQAASDISEIQSLSLGTALEFGFCGRERENYVPCYNVSATALTGFGDGVEFDRQCETEGAAARCLVRPPKDYKIPLRWPAGRDVIWGGNVKIRKQQFLSSGSATKRLTLLEENKVAFHSGDGLNFDTVKDYSHEIAEMIGLGSDSEFLQAGVRTVLDIECGFGSFGAHLFSLKLTTICIAAYEKVGSQVQVALERGLPAVIGSFSNRQLPFPTLSFDMIHCARCAVVWDKKDGASLFEVDRILKPGGYFVLTLPTRKSKGDSSGMSNNTIFTPIEEYAWKICWSLLGQQNETLIWQKTTDVNCYTSRKQGAVPLCEEENEAGLHYQPLFSCVSGTTSRRWVPIQNTSHWLADAQSSLEELGIHGVDPEVIVEDSSTWQTDLKNYWSLLTPLIFSDHPKRPGDEDPLPPLNMARNIMDMNAQYGGLNAALLAAKDSVWVMNVVPTGISNTLPLIFDRGFVGILHNWCESFPTYPRTFDMLHAAGLLSHQINAKKCDMLALLLEMDRILRPEGWAILRDNVLVIEKARALVAQVRWDARIIELQSDSDERLLVCQKPFLRK